MYQTPDFFNQLAFSGIAFPRLTGKSDNPKINLVQYNLECAWTGVLLFERVDLANISFAVKLEWDAKGYRIHVSIKYKEHTIL